MKLGWDVWFAGINRDGIVEEDGDARLVSAPLRFQTGRDKAGAIPSYRRHVRTMMVRARPDVLYFVNEESLLLSVGCLERGSGVTVVVDLYDSLRLRVSGKLRFLARRGSNYALERSNAIVVTDRRRQMLLSPSQREKAHCVENFPTYANSVEPLWRVPPSAPVRVLVAGGISDDRGFPDLVRAAEMSGAEVIAYGRVTDSLRTRRALGSHAVTYGGFLGQAEVYRVADSCDVMFGHYAPTNSNNLFASPNKLFDAYRVGRRICINSETEVAKSHDYSDVILATPFGDAESLADVLCRLSSDRERAAEVARQLYLRGKSDFSWESQESGIEQIFSNLGER